MTREKEITLAFTGASGAPYSLRLLQHLLNSHYKVHLLISSAARVVFATEQQLSIPSSPQRQTEFLSEYFDAEPEQISCYGREEWFSPVASGSAAPKTMVVCPCSTSTLSSIAFGASNTLIERAADVVIKERGQLILLVREMPLSSIHLQNMLTLSNLGVTIMPAAPGFYHAPQDIDDLIDFVVARILDHIGLNNSLMSRWGYASSKGQ